MKKDTFWIKNKPISRRSVLKAAGVSLSLPFLESMAANTNVKQAPKMVCILSDNGFLSEYFTPKGTGRNYAMSDYIKILSSFKNDMTVFSGVSLPEVDGAHATTSSYLTGAPHPGGSAFKNTISLDQYVAERVGTNTRLSSLPINIFSTDSISVSQSGVKIPAWNSASDIYKLMFIQGSQKEINRQLHNLSQGRSLLDFVYEDSKAFAKRVTANDRQKLEQFLTSVRETEKELQSQTGWLHKPKPKTNFREPKDIRGKNDILGRIKQMYQMIALALETDSTRISTLFINSGGFGRVYSIPGMRMNKGWHPLTHHSNNPRSKKMLKKIEETQFQALAGFLGQLRSKGLLDSTMVLHGSNLGKASNHDSKNMPMLLAGGGFKHGQHLAFNQKNNYPLTNLYLSMIQRMGVQCDKFSTSTGTMRGLEFS